MSNLGRREKHGGCIRACRDTGSATDACCCVKRSIRMLFWNQNRIGIGSASGGCANEATRLNDAVKRGSINHEVPDNREGTRAPRLERYRIAISEEAHRKLAYGCTALAAMGHAVDQETAGAADTLATIVLEGNGSLLPADQVLVEGIEHLEERYVGCHVAYLIGDEAARCVCALLPPNPKGEIHGYL